MGHIKQGNCLAYFGFESLSVALFLRRYVYGYLKIGFIQMGTSPPCPKISRSLRAHICFSTSKTAHVSAYRPSSNNFINTFATWFYLVYAHAAPPNISIVLHRAMRCILGYYDGGINRTTFSDISSCTRGAPRTISREIYSV